MNKIYLITGFLGSGKTTFLNYQLQDSPQKIGVLVNEFGKTNIDAMKIQSNGIIELNNGSIFCSCLKDNFIVQLSELIKREMDYILIEASGLSDPSNMQDVLQIISSQTDVPFEYCGAISIVDALYYERVKDVMVSVNNQIAQSAHVIINKVDLVEEDYLKKLKYLIYMVQKAVKIHETSYGQIDLFGLSETNYVPPLKESTNTVENRPLSIKVELLYDVSPELFIRFLEDIKTYILRGKGFVQYQRKLYLIEVVFDQVTSTEIEYSNQTVNEYILLMKNDLKNINQVAIQLEKHLMGQFKMEL